MTSFGPPCVYKLKTISGFSTSVSLSYILWIILPWGLFGGDCNSMSWHDEDELKIEIQGPQKHIQMGQKNSRVK